MATTSINTMVEALRAYRLLERAQLEELAGFQARFPTPQALARELLQRGWLGPYQANMLLQGQGAELNLGSYVILERLGEGAAGTIYKARHQSMNRLVALKVLRKDLLNDKDAIGRFYREVEVASHLSHPNVVHSYDAGVLGSSYFLAMEYVEGTDLQRLVKDQGPLPVAVACDYIRQAALGLQHAHERGMVHRDIKPSNLLVTRCVDRKSKVLPATSQAEAGGMDFGLVKVLDLGLARLAQPARGSTTRNLTVLAGNQVMMGTPDYLAPEQALDFHTADIRADIYSLGCTLYFLLSGRAPFEDGTLPEKLLRHQAVEPQSIQNLRPQVTTALAGVQRKMMAKRPSDRYQTPGDVSQALATLLATMSRPSFRLPSVSDVALQATPAPRKRGSTLRVPNAANGGAQKPSPDIQRAEPPARKPIVAVPRPTRVQIDPKSRRRLYVMLGAGTTGMLFLVPALLLLRPGDRDAGPVGVVPGDPTTRSAADTIRAGPRTLPAALVVQCGKDGGKQQDQIKREGFDYKLIQGSHHDGWGAVKSHCWHHGKELRFEVTVPPGTPGVLRLWFVDGDDLKRKQRLVVQGVSRGEFQGFAFVGEQVDVRLSAADTSTGKIDVSLHNLNPAVNAVVSSIEFLPTPR
ncbi:MAG: serine/threonine protein kinase [Gemmataceae bacterium]|nr:serine/threonine protein kinase [Gemmataceae bacterium]